MTTVRRGDTLLVAVPLGTGPEAAQRLKDDLKSRLSDVEVYVVVGAAGFAVVPKDAPLFASGRRTVTDDERPRRLPCPPKGGTW